MKVGVPRETFPGEKRVAIVPDSIKRLAAKKIEVLVETGAGEAAFAADADYEGAGAKVVGGGDLLGASDCILQIRQPTLEQIAKLKEGSALVSALFPLVPANAPLVKALAERKITAFAVDMIPRTTLAQMMDVLSSQATAAGYHAVVMAAASLPKFFPMLMTAAGTIAPARVLVLGAGVAGLTAIGTARRLGAVVEAFDVRKVVKEQVESLGAKFVEVAGGEDAAGAGGYAKETSEEYKQKQAALIAEKAEKADVIVATALIPGRPAPKLVTKEMVAKMRPGSVIVDLAAEQGGNCEVTKPGETAIVNGVRVIGEVNWAAQLAVHASQMYSRNMEKLFFHLTKDGEWKMDRAEEITAGCLVTHGGEIVHAKVKEAAG